MLWEDNKLYPRHLCFNSEQSSCGLDKRQKMRRAPWTWKVKKFEEVPSGSLQSFSTDTQCEQYYQNRCISWLCHNRMISTHLLAWVNHATKVGYEHPIISTSASVTQKHVRKFARSKENPYKVEQVLLCIIFLATRTTMLVFYICSTLSQREEDKHKNRDNEALSV